MKKNSHDTSSSLLSALTSSLAFQQKLTQLPTSSAGAPVVFPHAHPAGIGFLTSAIIHYLNKKDLLLSSNNKENSHHFPRRIWIVSPQLKAQEALFIQLQAWKQLLPPAATLIFIPEEEERDENITSISDPELKAERSTLLRQLSYLSQTPHALPLISITTLGLQQACPSEHDWDPCQYKLKVGTPLNSTQLIKTLHSLDYEKTAQVIRREQWAQRGGIIDIFPKNARHPLRIELFDTDIESLREFDIDTQISIRKCTEIDLYLQDPPSSQSLHDWIRPQDIVISTEGAMLDAHIIISDDAVMGAHDVEEDFSTAIFGNPLGSFEAGDFIVQEGKRRAVEQQLTQWHHQGWQVIMSYPHKSEQKRLLSLIKEEQKDTPTSATPPHSPWEKIFHNIISLAHGFTIPSAKIAILSAAELFGRNLTPTIAPHEQRQEKARQERAQANLREIHSGDLVVHLRYGIGKFSHISPATEDSDEEMVIEYQSQVFLKIPLSQSHLVTRYIGLGKSSPELSKLGDVRWQKQCQQAEKSVADYAAQLLTVQSQRESGIGYAHPPDTKWMHEFDNAFPYKETVDQRRAIAQTKADMESPKPMDRLICGDVGFGKTEIALRAAFKCVTGGKQALLLAPTTVLAEQHWRTFRQRMSEYPIRIELLNRFRTAKEIKSTLAGLADGSIDIVIGTHRLVSPDVKLNNPGLVIIDEEQRFGVQHKEKFKERFHNLDILTLSATPIPRTLYMALMGARDMSTIDTPPPNRRPVSTSICAYDERLIKRAIEKELARGGQVYFLYNRVKTITQMQQRLQMLAPEAKIVVGHGQMEKSDLEEIMHQFVEGKADVLLATTIIESGIDIPNANTIIIDRADRFGLADLYQLRGRVGRSGHQAYAYLLLPRKELTTSDAHKRINAIRQYSELGSGFKIAMRDLEIRGAGNLLGTQQSGHIAAIGFDLYCQLLRQSIDTLQGKSPQQRTECTLRADFLIWSQTTATQLTKAEAKTHLTAYLPTHYIPDAPQRMSAFKALAQCQNGEDINKLQSEWQDRYGTLPAPVKTLILTQLIRLSASLAKISLVEIKGQRLMLTRNGSYILLSQKVFPKLNTTQPAKKLQESLQLIQSL